MVCLLMSHHLFYPISKRLRLIIKRFSNKDHVYCSDSILNSADPGTGLLFINEIVVNMVKDEILHMNMIFMAGYGVNHFNKSWLSPDRHTGTCIE